MKLLGRLYDELLFYYTVYPSERNSHQLILGFDWTPPIIIIVAACAYLISHKRTTVGVPTSIQLDANNFSPPKKSNLALAEVLKVSL